MHINILVVLQVLQMHVVVGSDEVLLLLLGVHVTTIVLLLLDLHVSVFILSMGEGMI